MIIINDWNWLKDEDEDDFLVEEKPKDDLDLKTESIAPDNEVKFTIKYQSNPFAQILNEN